MQNILALFQEDPNEQEAKIRQEQIDIQQQNRERYQRMLSVQATRAKELSILKQNDLAIERDKVKVENNKKLAQSAEWATKLGARSITAEGGRTAAKGRQQRLSPLAVMAKVQATTRGLDPLLSAAQNKATRQWHVDQDKANNIEGIGAPAIPGHTYKVKTGAEKWTMAGLDALKLASSAGAFGTFAAAGTPGVSAAEAGTNATLWQRLFRGKHQFS